jgi:AAA15 family ATPase/GTPase
MVANSDQRFAEGNCSPTDLTAISSLLNSAAIYGPNASGKSSLIIAMEFMRNMVAMSSNILEGQPLNVAPFRFNNYNLTKPTEFEIHFIEDGKRYQYGFSLDKQQVLNEWLSVYVGRKAQRWFERKFDQAENKYTWSFGSYFAGGNQRKVWRDATRRNALFLSTAINLNCEQLKPIFYWFVNKLTIVRGNMPASPSSTLEFIKNEGDKLNAIQFLQAADLGITDIQVETRKRMGAEFKFERDGKHQLNSHKEIEFSVITLRHNDVGFDFTEESDGTQRILAYIGFFLNALKEGKTLIIDELEASLHTKLSQFLISLFHDPKVNKNKAQLIFSTHDTSLLDSDLFRRDQIWFMEKDSTNASRLYPLTDYSPRPSEALEKGYLQGRYGALPFFGEFKFND